MAPFSCILLAAGLLLCPGAAFDILLFPVFTRSNQIFFESVETELRLVGHQVTLLVFQDHLGARKPPPPDAIVVPGGDADASLRQWERAALEAWSEEAAIFPWVITDALQRQCVALLGQTKIVEALRTGVRPNVVLADVRFGACGLALGRLLQAPVVGVQASPHPLRTAASHVPVLMDRKANGSGFWDRLKSTLEGLINVNGEAEAAAVCELAPPCRSSDDLYADLSMVLVNSFATWDAPIRPVYPKLVYVGGLNFHTTALLPKDLEVIAREHRAGIILITLISSISDEMFPDYVRSSLITGLGRLPHAIFWKANLSNASNLTSNMFFNEKFQSQNIMGHVRTRLVISFCDRDTVFVAIYHRMPLLCIPVLEDQVDLARRVEEQGIGVVLKLTQLNPDSLVAAVHSITTNASFRENMRYHADLLRDQPSTASDRLIYWTRYVIVHKGARHLRNPAMQLQLTLLDIGVLVMCAVLATTALTVFAVRGCSGAAKVKNNNTPKKHKKKSE